MNTHLRALAVLRAESLPDLDRALLARDALVAALDVPADEVQPERHGAAAEGPGVVVALTTGGAEWTCMVHVVGQRVALYTDASAARVLAHTIGCAVRALADLDLPDHVRAAAAQWLLGVADPQETP